MAKKAALIILDGWGIGKKDESDGVHQAKTPFYDQLIQNHPNNVLKTFGENVEKYIKYEKMCRGRSMRAAFNNVVSAIFIFHSADPTRENLLAERPPQAQQPK